MPMKIDEMKTMTTRKICQDTPIAALPRKPTKLPTMMWSIMPWMPPMTLVSIVGHAIFQTASLSGPSTMERSYLRLGRPGTDGAPAAGEAAAGAGWDAAGAVVGVDSGTV